MRRRAATLAGGPPRALLAAGAALGALLAAGAALGALLAAAFLVPAAAFARAAGRPPWHRR